MKISDIPIIKAVKLKVVKAIVAALNNFNLTGATGNVTSAAFGQRFIISSKSGDCVAVTSPPQNYITAYFF